MKVREEISIPEDREKRGLNCPMSTPKFKNLTKIQRIDFY
jgi:hypothetical protein